MRKETSERHPFSADSGTTTSLRFLVAHLPYASTEHFWGSFLQDDLRLHLEAVFARQINVPRNGAGLDKFE